MAIGAKQMSSCHDAAAAAKQRLRAVRTDKLELCVRLPCLLLLQAVFAKQKESYIEQLMKADAAKQQLQASVQQMEEQLVRATAEVQQRRQQAADKGEDADRQVSLLRKVRCM
jgi:DNA repair ATPase RecN